MKIIVLLTNVLLKSVTLCVLILFSLNGMAQKKTINCGSKCKIYYEVEEDYPYHRCVANIISSKDLAFTKEILADKITFIDRDFVATTKHGYFVEFSYSGIRYIYNRIFFRMGGKEYAIVQNGNSLNLVNIEKDEVMGIITTDLNKGDDFSILVSRKSDIYITNNGTLNIYDIGEIESNTSSVRSQKVAVNESNTYSLDGKQVESPHEGIFIKDRKKVIIK